MRTLRVLVVAVALLLLGPEVGAATVAGVRPPPVNAPADYQLGGAYRPAAGVRVVSRDRLDRPAPGRYSICYLNAFQTQPGTLTWWRAHHPGLLLRRHGRLVRDPGWPDEVLLDTRTAASRRALAAVEQPWITRCGRDGFAGLEPDNLDSFTRSLGLLTRAGNLAFARIVVVTGHAAGLAVAQKNLAGLPRPAVDRIGFDFAVAEDCQVYDECAAYRHVYGGHVIEIEYADSGRANFRTACARRGRVWSIVYRDRELRTPDRPGYVRAAC